jgi:hypothetical protein
MTIIKSATRLKTDSSLYYEIREKITFSMLMCLLSIIMILFLASVVSGFAYLHGFTTPVDNYLWIGNVITGLIVIATWIDSRIG